MPYLVAYQCEFALRTILAEPCAQFDLVSKDNMADEVISLMKKHLQGRDDLPGNAVIRLAGQFGNGLGFQLRSMPIAIRIDKQLFDHHPELREQQQISIDRQLQENMHALSPQAKEIAPEEIIRPNASMNAAFAKFFFWTLNAPMIFAPFVAAGFSTIATELLAVHSTVTSSPDHDRELVDAWAQKLGLDRWFKTRPR